MQKIKSILKNVLTDKFQRIILKIERCSKILIVVLLWIWKESYHNGKKKIDT